MFRSSVTATDKVPIAQTTKAENSSKCIMPGTVSRKIRRCSKVLSTKRAIPCDHDSGRFSGAPSFQIR